MSAAPAIVRLSVCAATHQCRPPCPQSNKCTATPMSRPPSRRGGNSASLTEGTQRPAMPGRARAQCSISRRRSLVSRWDHPDRRARRATPRTAALTPVSFCGACYCSSIPDPNNIMYDKRVVRGNTYAAQILPAVRAPTATNAPSPRAPSAAAAENPLPCQTEPLLAACTFHAARRPRLRSPPPSSRRRIV